MPSQVVEFTLLAGDAEQVARQFSRVMRPDVRSMTICPHTAPEAPLDRVTQAFAEDVMLRVDQLTGG